MNAKLRAAFVIARRDYVATVFSKTFLLFLIGPLLPLIFALAFAAIGVGSDQDSAEPTIAVIANGKMAAAIRASSDRLSSADIAEIAIHAPSRDEPAQVRRLLSRPGVVAVLSGLPASPVLTGTARMVDRYDGPAGLILDDARRELALDAAHARPRPLAIARHPIDRAAAVEASDRKATARGAQFVLVMLTIILAGMLLSNLTEEKSNKVIEILAAAVPVDAIFFGKLLAMLGMSLTGIAIWGSVAAIAVPSFAPNLIAGLGAPSIGWPLLLLLGIVYFIASYLLLGALFLGIGAQASSVREVQTLSMPVTMAQVGVFGLGAMAVNHPDSGLGLVAAIFPWSSPFAMIARAAQRPELWPHLIAILWQAGWVALIIAIGARMFRRSVLKSGGPKGGLLAALRRSIRGSE
jgi:ABC-2 type transport system permease protein